MPITFETDKDLAHYRRGRLLKQGELRAMPDGTVVWATYTEYGDETPRIDGACRIEFDGPGSWVLDEGSSFIGYFVARGSDSDDCYDSPCGEGDFYVYEAVHSD